MGSLIVDDRDQRFVLYEVLKAEEICETPLYANFSRDVFHAAHPRRVLCRNGMIPWRFVQAWDGEGS